MVRHGWRMGVRGLLLATLGALLLAPPAAAADQDPQVLVRMPVPPGRALVYVFRPSLFGPKVPIAVEANGQSIGSTLAETFFVIDVPPGAVHLVSRGDNVAELQFDAQAGQRYFVLQEATMGVASALTKLELVHPERGREGVEVGRLVQMLKL
jgi:Protein of unknown function (DUF2846)